MPQNWLRQSVCTDVFYPPEIFPSEATVSLKYDGPTFAVFIGGLKDGLHVLKVNRSFGKRAVNILLLPFTFLVFFFPFLPSLIYRVSFKATTFVYYPFVFVAGATVGSDETLKTRLKRFTDSELEKARRWVSVLVLTASLFKVGLIVGWINVSDAIKQFTSEKFVNTFLIPHVWHWWQLTLVTDAVLTFFLLFYADAALRRTEVDEDKWNEEMVTKTVSGVSFVRASLAVVTMSYFFWFAFKAATSKYLHLS